MEHAGIIIGFTTLLGAIQAVCVWLHYRRRHGR